MRDKLALLLLLLLLTACNTTGEPLVTHAAMLTVDQPVEQTITGPHHEHRWSFTAATNHTINLHFDTDSPQTTLNVLPPDGAASQEFHPQATAQPLQLTTSGTYTFVVVKKDNGTSRYHLAARTASPQTATEVSAAQQQPTPTAPPIRTTATLPPITATAAPPIIGPGARLQDHQLIRGRIQEWGGQEHYTIFGRAYETITVGALAEPDSTVDPLITIYTPSGEILAQSDNSFGSPDAITSGVMLPTTGAYVVFVQDATQQGMGYYQLAYGHGFTMRQNEQPPLPPETVITGLLGQIATRDIWPLDLTMGDIISAAVVVDEGSDLDPILSLVAPDGTTTYLDDNSGGGVNAALRQIIIPQTGQFYLAVSPARDLSLGTYTLIWRYDAQMPTPTP